MNKINGRFAVLALVSASLLGTQAAQAEKYLVSFKNKAAFNQVHAQFMLQQSMQLGDVSFFAGIGPAVIVEDSLKHLNTVVVDIENPAQLKELMASGQVEQVEREMFHPAPLPIQGFQPWKPWNVDMGQILASNPTATKTPYGIKLVRSQEAWAVNGKGAGARVLVLDTGMDVNHPALAPNYEKGKDFNSAGDSSDVTDVVGHGTHVAGTVAAVLAMDGFTGVAPEAKS